MHIHILGICGTFMGSLAVLARELGHRVTGSDQQVYPPMSTQLMEAGIDIVAGYDPEQLNPAPDLVIIGNAMSRGNPCVEAVLDRGLRYTSGPQWLHDEVLSSKWVLAVAGTHGKTTTASLLAWILEYAGMQPGFLIGGVPRNFPQSARLGGSDFFVIEADEYDTAFFDKRSKFVHYAPRTVILNNLEFDHADIFADLAAIETQFHHLVRIVPGSGQIIHSAESPALQRVLERGCWTPAVPARVVAEPQSGWWVRALVPSGEVFEIGCDAQVLTRVNWSLTGEHNLQNALHAALAARHVGITLDSVGEALAQFQSVKRRMELVAEVKGVAVYDDFAHHPTAIAKTLAGIRARVGTAPVVAVIEPRSNTMKRGVFGDQLADSARDADSVYWYQPPGQGWSLPDVLPSGDERHRVYPDTQALIDALVQNVAPGSHIVIMSNGGFDGIHGRLQQALARG